MSSATFHSAATIAMPQVLVHCYCTPVLAELQSQIWNPEPSQEQKVSGDSVFLFFWGRAGFRGPHVNPKNNPVKPKVLTGRSIGFRFLNSGLDARQQAGIISFTVRQASAAAAAAFAAST